MHEARETSWAGAFRLSGCILIAVAFSACETVVVSMVEISEVAVVPASITLLPGESEAASAVVTESGGLEHSDLPVTWTVDDSRIATVTAEGVVQALLPGTTTVRASSEGVSGAAVVRVLIGPDSEPTPNCEIADRTIIGTYEVPRNARCTFTDVRILGGLELREGSSLVGTRLTVSGRVQADRALELVLDDSRLFGELIFERGGSVTIRDTDIERKVELRANLGVITVSDSWIDDSLTLESNRGGPFTLLRNTSERLQCKENDPAPTGGGNVVEGGEDGGQCEGL
jgi:hypothetical protein